MSLKTLVFAATVLIPFSSAAAQTLQARAGDRVRVTAPPSGLANQIARVESVRNDTLVLQLKNETRSVPIAALSRLDVSTGRHRHTLQGAGIGGLGGAALGAISGYASGDDDPNQFLAMTAGGKAALGAVLIGGVGLVVGSVVGALHVTDQWTTLPLGETKTTPAIELGAHTVRLGMRLSF